MSRARGLNLSRIAAAATRLLPASAHLGRNVSSVATLSTRFQVLLHLKTQLFVLNIFVVNSHCLVVFFFQCLFFFFTIWVFCFGVFSKWKSHDDSDGKGNMHDSAVWRKTEMQQKQMSPRGRSRHRTFQSNSGRCRN